MNKTKVELKYNKCTRFLLPGLKIKDSLLLEMGFENLYLCDNEYDIRWDLENCLYLVFKPNIHSSKFEENCKKLRALENFKDEYDVKDYVVFVFQFPEKYKNVITSFIKGEYSKFDKLYVKECIPQLVNGKISIRWKIIYKDEELFKELAEDLGYKNLDIAKQYINELEELPYAEEEIFRYNPEIHTNLTRKND